MEDELDISLDAATRATVNVVISKRDITAADLEQLIAELPALRADMQPPVAFDPPLGGSVKTVENPRYWICPAAMSDGLMLGLRHQGHGWLWFVFPPHEIARLIELLTHTEHSRTAQKPRVQ